MADNLANLDGGGTNCQFVRTWMGPTLGWMMLPVVPEAFSQSASPIVIVGTSVSNNAYCSRLILKHAVKSITLPSVKQWMTATPALTNSGAFDRSIWIKDLIGAVSNAAPLVFTPFNVDQIDGLTTWSMINAYDCVQFYPLTDLSGWYTV